METLTIEHIDADGTLIYGTERGDGTAEVLKAHRWRWGRSIGAWYVPRSRDRVPNRALIDATAAALRDAGFGVEISIDTTVSDQSEAEERRLAREAARAEVMSERAGRRHREADSRAAAADALSEGIPMGQPILVGHHSQRRHERTLERIHSHTAASVDLERKARHAEARAETAEAAARHRNNSVTVANRIERLGAELRKLERTLARCRHTEQVESPDTTRLEELATHTRAQLEYWQGVRTEQLRTGEATDYGPASVEAGDVVKLSGRWRRVVRANKKTVSVETGYSWTDREPWHKVQDHRSVSDVTCTESPGEVAGEENADDE